MGINSSQKLLWNQRIALVRHNFHAARRSGDYTFFKALQAHALIHGTDHVAILHSMLGDDADFVLSTLDNLNAGIAYVHQDAFKAVYDGVKSTMYITSNSSLSRRSLLHVDISQQRDMADNAIDKSTNSAISLIEAQPVHCQDAIANAWITGTTIIVDAVCVCLKQMDEIETYLDDFIRLEYAWSSIQSSVDAAISALRGIFNLMSSESSGDSRSQSISSAVGSDSAGSRSRTSSTASAFSLIKRAFSHSHLQTPPQVRPGRNNSLPLPESNPRGLRLSMNAACPSRMPQSFNEIRHTQLTTIPHTPSIHEASAPDIDAMTPFKEKTDYFAFTMDEPSDEGSKESPMRGQDTMQLESLDPLYSPPGDEGIEMPVPLTL
ncbi:hypothetical protein CC78DRAFT_571000 [Lojkania enalia]|uniref:Uncharacterized protein n=1 Tax=Lojkania enalia TaxID=147567 RepID=A0A9P4MX05_9PLEO|nr:hypothetical protein CC78DRAFT_571000 [Didymosphaeria enalia]